jgi:hypothetical protein
MTRTVTSETQKENHSRRCSPYGSTRTYLREKTDQKKTEYRRIKKRRLEASERSRQQ